jgi:arylsulfate sulfotransferase
VSVNKCDRLRISAHPSELQSGFVRSHNENNLCLMTKLLISLAFPVYATAAMSVSLATSLPSPQPLGTLVRFSATVSGAAAGDLRYRFQVRERGFEGPHRHLEAPYRIVVDFGPNANLDWTTIAQEGGVEMEVAVRNAATGETATDRVEYTFARVAQTDPIATATAHPLVFLYSAPPCPEGARMRVRFSTDGGPVTTTPLQPCNSRHSMNFYLAGMRPGTAYTAVHTVQFAASASDGPAVTFTTGASAFQAPAASPISTPLPTVDTVMLHGAVNSNTFATDLNGNLLWYGPPGMTFLTRVVPGGTFLSIFEDGAQDTAHQFVREFDLAGVTVAETNAARINDQLATMGRHPITSFHHEAIRLANGSYLVMAGSERTLSGVQGAGAADVLGDIILVLDRNLQVQWFWDAFDYLDPRRAAVLQETCAYPATVACSAFYNGKSANDWLHGNSLDLTPDGDILYSVRHQDWVVKIDYRNGAGTGRILWRLGTGGDFTISGGGAHPWFSHQHDSHFLSDNTTLILFDNGNTRIAQNPGELSSRGQVLKIDEKAHTATVVMNADLKQSSAALGTAELLDNGNYHFDAGFIQDPSNPAARFTQLLETDPAGNLVWGMQVAAQEYRSYRMNDLYTPPRQ